MVPERGGPAAYTWSSWIRLSSGCPPWSSSTGVVVSWLGNEASSCSLTPRTRGGGCLRNT